MTKDEKLCEERSKTLSEHLIREKPHRQRTPRKEKVKPQTKIVIRHLPPTMTEEDFLRQVEPLPEHDLYYFVNADWSLGYDATCRAYLNLKNYEDVFLFRDRFDGYVFVDSKGAEYSAIVEFAPFQGLTKNKSRKSDPKANTIEFEPHYKNFLMGLEEEREAAAKGVELKLDFFLDRKKEEKITSTPLLQYLASKKEKRREESKRRLEEKKRQREEEKDRRQRQQQLTSKFVNEPEVNKKDTLKSGSGKDSQISEKVDNAAEERKNTRSKKRAERDQRRREEHEQRKRERDRIELDHGEKDSSKVSEDKMTIADNHRKGENMKFTKYESDIRSIESSKLEDFNTKEVKKYSERRERDRDRNRNRRDKERQKFVPSTDMHPGKSSADASKDDEINDSVKNFIRSVKEFVPIQRKFESEGKLKEYESSTSGMGRKSIAKNLIEESEKMSSVVVEDGRGEVDGCNSENVAGTSGQQEQKQRLAEERRIRNKNRPSIVIYQPKARLRQSEEREQASARDVRSNSTSDCEGLKKDEQAAKKVSRYSERRSERRSRDK